MKSSPISVDIVAAVARKYVVPYYQELAREPSLFEKWLEDRPIEHVPEHISEMP
jgi:hypothetical protein